ncbi:MAG: hypothetical protein FJ218_08990 [Ignavibacteria bacterium]|nr:hypothetical protein [Ignavibacteria bacterium]
MVRYIFFLLIFFGTVVFSQSSKTLLSLDITYEYDTGIPKTLTISGNPEQTPLWLGTSLYPYGVVDVLGQGIHKQIEIKKTPFKETIELGKNVYSGSFEIALYRKKIEREDCAEDSGCYWCKRNGFHLEELLEYKNGYLFWK